ncbi:MAG: PQQ-binding-like beta-propeller repeat protein, partial [Armatimonadetes bacterium]|nr:PQQ-binding-like beta-propeller repeat protein [Armatimonadota bacterium]
GVELWRQQIGGVVDSSPAVADAKAYFGAHDGCLYAVDAATGQVQARLRLAPKIFSSPALVEGRLYIGASDGRLYCIK